MNYDTIYAIDFDGTLCKDAYPKIGEPIEYMIEFCKAKKSAGCKLILSTCRKDKLLVDAIIWCESKGIVFDAVNANLPEVIEKYGGDTRKISATYYIDDRNVPMDDCRVEMKARQWAIDAGLILGSGDLTNNVIEGLKKKVKERE